VSMHFDKTESSSSEDDLPTVEIDEQERIPHVVGSFCALCSVTFASCSLLFGSSDVPWFRLRVL